MAEQPRAFAAHQVRSGDRWRIKLHGELDLASAPLLEAKLHEARRGGATHLELDLSDLEFIDSTGLTVLVEAHRAAQSSGNTFALRGQNPQAQRLFELTATHDLFTFVDGSARPLTSPQA